jgi:hypothetical protein
MAVKLAPSFADAARVLRGVRGGVRFRLRGSLPTSWQVDAKLGRVMAANLALSFAGGASPARRWRSWDG